MQRTLTFVGFIILFAIGAAVLAGSPAIGNNAYQLPQDPIWTAILLGAIVAILILPFVAGGAIGTLVNILSKQVSARLSADDRPEIEKRALAALERLLHAKPVEKGLRWVGYGESQAPTPYVPPYSYKALPENAEVRQFSIGVVIVAALLVGYAAASHWSAWTEGTQALLQTKIKLPGTEAELPLGLIPIVASVVLLGAIGVVGVGLSLWFYRTQAEKVKAEALPGPAWPVPQMTTLEQRMKTAPQAFKQMTFLNKLLIALNVGLVVILLGGIAVWVAPGVLTVVAVDQAARPTVAPPAAPTAVAANPGGGGSPAPKDLQEELAALPKGDAATGEKIFKEQQPCHVCHIDTSNGPPIAGVATRAATRKPGYSAELYFYESITRPGDFLVPDFTVIVPMPTNFKEILKPQEIADLIAYLDTLK